MASSGGLRYTVDSHGRDRPTAKEASMQKFIDGGKRYPDIQRGVKTGGCIPSADAIGTVGGGPFSVTIGI